MLTIKSSTKLHHQYFIFWPLSQILTNSPIPPPIPQFTNLIIHTLNYHLKMADATTSAAPPILIEQLLSIHHHLHRLE